MSVLDPIDPDWRGRDQERRRPAARRPAPAPRPARPPRAEAATAVARAARPEPVVAPAERPRTPRHLRLAPTPTRRQRLARVFVAFGGLLTIASLFIIVASNVVMAQHSYELGEIRERQREAQRRNGELRAEVAELSSPARIVAEAEALGMVPAQSFGFVEADTAPAAGVPAEPVDEVAQTLSDTAGRTRDADADPAP